MSTLISTRCRRQGRAGGGRSFCRMNLVKERVSGKKAARERERGKNIYYKCDQTLIYNISYHYEDCETRKPMSLVRGQGMWQSKAGVSSYWWSRSIDRWGLMMSLAEEMLTNPIPPHAPPKRRKKSSINMCLKVDGPLPPFTSLFIDIEWTRDLIYHHSSMMLYLCFPSLLFNTSRWGTWGYSAFSYHSGRYVHPGRAPGSSLHIGNRLSSLLKSYLWGRMV